MYITLFFVVFVIHTINAFSCPSSNGLYVNPDDYRSYYVCSNYCYHLEYCLSPTIYFTRVNQTCVREPPNWEVRYNLTGQFKSIENTDIFIQQEGYNVSIAHETITTHYRLLARYINETHAIGIQTAHRLINNCIVLFNIRLVVTGDREYCYYETIHQHSSICDLWRNYSGNYCKTY